MRGIRVCGTHCDGHAHCVVRGVDIFLICPLLAVRDGHVLRVGAEVERDRMGMLVVSFEEWTHS